MAGGPLSENRMPSPPVRALVWWQPRFGSCSLTFSNPCSLSTFRGGHHSSRELRAVLPPFCPRQVSEACRLLDAAVETPALKLVFPVLLVALLPVMFSKHVLIQPHGRMLLLQFGLVCLIGPPSACSSLLHPG